MMRQDVLHRGYQRAMDAVAAAMDEPALIYAAGHDHGLQVLKGGYGFRTLVVSGSGTSAHSDDPELGAVPPEFARKTPGFMTVDAYDDGAIMLSVYMTSLDEVHKVLLVPP